LKDYHGYCIVGDPTHNDNHHCVVESGDTHPRALGHWRLKPENANADGSVLPEASGNVNHHTEGQGEGEEEEEEESSPDWGE
jgi:hypothetical protein